MFCQTRTRNLAFRILALLINRLLRPPYNILYIYIYILLLLKTAVGKKLPFANVAFSLFMFYFDHYCYCVHSTNLLLAAFGALLLTHFFFFLLCGRFLRLNAHKRNWQQYFAWISVLPALIAAPQQQEQNRVWSAHCMTHDCICIHMYIHIYKVIY